MTCNVDLNGISENKLGVTLAEASDQQIYGLLMDEVRERCAAAPLNDGKRKLYYISAEFLIGKLLSNNLIDLGLFDEVRAQLAEAGHDLGAIEELEAEPSLGNGGLGRLAACFLDSIATLGLPGDGVGLNYHYGLFHQGFIDNQQAALPDEWLAEQGWLVPEERTYTVEFGDFSVTSKLYDIDVPGYGQPGKNRLRLFDLQGVDDEIVPSDSIDFDKLALKKNLTLFLYPDDSDEDGRMLRIYQQYFMVSNAAQLIIDEALERGSNLRDLDEYAVVQINDTHPTMVIPELIRLLTEKHGIEFDEAVGIVSRMAAYTNHTILAEALEKWPLKSLQKVAPRMADVIVRLDKLARAAHDDPRVAIIDENDVVHMARIDIHFGYSINGVAALHTEILKNTELRPFYDIYPEKFSNKTNGITFRRWLMGCNPELAALLDDAIGTDWRRTGDLTPLAALVDDADTLSRFGEVKAAAKTRMRSFLTRTQGAKIPEDAIIDVQVKRIHEYKRQQMNALYIIWKYLDIKNGNIPAHPLTIVFGGKAAPAYVIAQDVIHLVLTLSQWIANDPDVAPYLQVVMIENYNVSAAEHVIPAADISEQISLASKEASGTSNMKFMLNGALTLCTLDGANVEIAELVGDENIYTFGASSQQVEKLYADGTYDAAALYRRPGTKLLVDFMTSPAFMATGNAERLQRLHDDIAGKDWFMALLDLEEYIQKKEEVLRDYEDREAWGKKALVNIAQAGAFSSDRTIAQYNGEIWHLK
ncbi:glycogen/starch/alpha-glucan family phosphorylase [Paratractidigestivibacter sp.]|uniref:glycogen/starch/alpha-glucan family phosphorylase n=1 Tax=Paratractidigestivibacter sp. TaxID=2847316 RepID=UPI002ABDDF2B|nr:glycogen/starch/alpha-glucan family phosphorylase [Paratractidigestivibacter sp.]